MTMQEWAKYHAALFGLHKPEDQAMLAGWWLLFERQGFTGDELREATDWIAMNHAAAYRTEHLAFLQERVKASRAKPLRPLAPGPEPDGRGDCVLCLGTGRVIVPSPRALANGTWGTQAVLCTCAAGRWFVGRQGDRPQQTLEDFEREMPREEWQGRLANHAFVLSERVRLHGQAGQLDKLAGQILARARRGSHA